MQPSRLPTSKKKNNSKADNSNNNNNNNNFNETKKISEIFVYWLTIGVPEVMYI